jgi:protoporphyrinogen oxidase
MGTDTQRPDDAPRPAFPRTQTAPGPIPHRWTRVQDPEATAVVAAFDTVIAGAGPAGLTAAYELTKHGHRCVALEADTRHVGGISRTEQYKGYRFDIGGHRFFSKSDEVNRLWEEIIGEEFLTRPRLSRIYYDRKFFHYPLKPLDAFRKLGPITSFRILLSYLRARLWPIQPEVSLEDWVTNRFGRLLFQIFFKTYTEKVWGIPTSSISADWAAQRIKGLSLTKAVWNALFAGKSGKKGQIIKTLIDEFRYPRLGPGQMWQAARDQVERGGNAVHMDRRVVRIEHDGTRVEALIARDSAGRETRYEGRHFVSTMPMRELIAAMSPAAPPEVVEAAASLKYRDHLTVVLIVEGDHSFPDNWVYVHDPSVKLGRVQNFRNWSRDMVPDPNRTSLGLEYFCFEGDGLWTMSDPDLIALGREEMTRIGLIRPDSVVDGCVVRMPKAYPVYDEVYQAHVATLRAWLANLANLELAGRNGMHKYNNQDHSMMTALLAARNILGLGRYDTWKVNTDAEYHEQSVESADSGGRAVPRAVSTSG